MPISPKIKISLLSVFATIVLLAILLVLTNVHLGITSSDIDYGTDYKEMAKLNESRRELPRQIVIFIADGLGFGHISLASLTRPGKDTPPPWHDFPVQGWHDARSAIGPLTDSEASATAMATGVSTNFGYIGLDLEGNPVENIMELASKNGYNTGIVTDSYVWDGTPAAFVAHTSDEDDARDILTQMAASDLSILIGELEDLGEDEIPEEAESKEILAKRFQILPRSLEVPVPPYPLTPIAAIYDEEEITDLDSNPTLPKLTQLALDYISAANKSFVLLVECEEIDTASHNNDSDRVVRGMHVIEATLDIIKKFSEENEETLVLFTSDHETGGLSAVSDWDDYPKMQIRWTTRNHTAAVVPFYASGPGSEAFAGIKRNWEIGRVLQTMIIADSINEK